MSPVPEYLHDEPLVLGDIALQSRLLVGTGKYATLEETDRRREIQERFNRENGITPTTVVKRISDLRDSIWERDYVTVPVPEKRGAEIPTHELPELIDALRQEMGEAAKRLEYERAADLRDRIRDLEAERLRTH